MVMRKTGLGRSLLRRPVKVEPENAKSREVDVVHARLHESDLLSLADEQEGGTDPYNNTGQYATLPSKKRK